MGSFESTLAGAVHPALGDDDEHEQPPPGCNLFPERTPLIVENPPRCAW
jgi:hypothetical protein